MTRRRMALQTLATVGTLGAWSQGQAATFPDRPIRLVVPFAPGAGTDAVGRLVAAKLAEVLGQQVLVENRTGASGAIGAQAVAQSAPDGHTLLLAAAPFTTVAAAVPNAGYDALTQFVPVGMIAQGPLVWAVSDKLPVSTVQELVRHAKARPGALNYGSAGVGGINHLVLELFKLRTGTFITHIPYRGIAPATVDAIAGEIHMLTGTIPALAPYLREGRLKALAVTGMRRSPALPQVPTMAEAGLKGFNVLNYFGLVAPRGTPVTVVDHLNAALARVLDMPEVRERLGRDAVEPAPGSPAQLGQFLKTDVEAWASVVKRQGLKIDPF
ncbi:tripartite tricarboxylate transporter substrate binding protein [Hydrogenophaga sp. OTU3427]|uniref:tripartite tricarboxylate transporter substrate binding protein n=1 Tax=Hydrogenophaga sp. OTU3427 TaxID=3043856 RepID=UPI00313EB28D